MIVRDAVISEDRVRLGFRIAPVGEPVADEPLRPVLEREEVIQWLAGQSADTRRACARVLAIELEELRAAAHEQGYVAGETAGIREVESRRGAAVALVSRIAEEIEVANRRTNQELTQSCAAVVAEAFTKIAGEYLVAPAATVGAVRSVLSRLREGNSYTVFVYPTDLDACEAARDSLQLMLGAAPVAIKVDPELTMGGCRVESALGMFDARFEVQLRNLFEILRAAHVPEPAIR
jgi:flagellar assembly protein FliH